MHTAQTTLTASDTDDDPTTGDPSATNGTPKSTTQTDRKNPPTEEDGTLASPEKRGGEGCCPWCLAASETFVHHEDGRAGCGHCDAAIPVGAEWYERGEKIVV